MNSFEKAILRTLLILTAAILSNCGSKSGDQTVKAKSVSSKEVDADTIRLVDAGMKGHLLTMMMATVTFQDQRLPAIENTQRRDSVVPMALDVAQFGEPMTGLGSVQENLFEIVRAENRKLIANRKASSEVGSVLRVVERLYMQILDYRESLGDSASYRLKVMSSRCSDLPTLNIPIHDWRSCVSRYRPSDDSTLMSQADYGRSMAQAIFRRDLKSELPADWDSNSTKPRAAQIASALRAEIDRPIGPDTLSDEARSELINVWGQITASSANRDDITATPLFAEFELMLDHYSLAELEQMVGRELAVLTGELRNRIEIARRTLVQADGSVLDDATLEEFDRRLFFSKGVAMSAYIKDLDVRFKMADELRARPELAEQERAYASTLRSQLIKYWNGMVTQDQLVEASLNRLSESTLKCALAKNLRQAVTESAEYRPFRIPTTNINLSGSATADTHR